MAFSNGKAGFTWLGVSHPPVPATAVYCDPCALGGAVPFKVDGCSKCGATAHTFHPNKEGGAGCTCDGCGAPVHYQQERPWAWEPAGWNRETDATACSGCGKPAASGRPFWAREGEPA